MSPERRKGGGQNTKNLVKGLHEQTDKLYQCHVLEMGVITKQQEQINDLKRELKIVKSVCFSVFCMLSTLSRRSSVLLLCYVVFGESLS